MYFATNGIYAFFELLFLVKGCCLRGTKAQYFSNILQCVLKQTTFFFSFGYMCVSVYSITITVILSSLLYERMGEWHESLFKWHSQKTHIYVCMHIYTYFLPLRKTISTPLNVSLMRCSKARTYNNDDDFECWNMKIQFGNEFILKPWQTD